MHPESPVQSPEKGSAAATTDEPRSRPQTLELLQRFYRGQQQVRRGICLLNAGQYEQASEAFALAARANPESRSLPTLMAACHVGSGEYDSAAGELARAVEREADDVTARVRHALSLWQASRPGEAIASLRNSLRCTPESAELHFQLGIMLAALEETEEAELRFTQAVAIDRTHTEALVSLGLCAAARERPAEAKRYLERAQRRRPQDARIGLLLAQAARSLADQGLTVDMQAEMPGEEPEADDEAVEQLSRVVEVEPEFVDAFLEMGAANLNADFDREVYSVLADTLNRAVGRCPEQAALHCAAGRVLDRLGKPDEAVAATERAVDLNPSYAPALVQLARLYQQTDRHQDALVRLEEALNLGVRYADVYYMLGNLYRRSGKLERARRAYEQALKVNDGYEAARAALATLAA